MSSRRRTAFAVAVIGAVTIAACSGSVVDEEAPAASTGSEAAVQAPPSEQPASSPGATSYATVTINGETWEFTPFRCAVGKEQTGSDTYSFSTDARSAVGEDGVQVQFQVNARDDSGQDRLVGDGVVYDFTLYDYGSETPTVDYSGDATDGVTIAPGTLEVNGEFSSLSGETYTVVVDGVCAA